MKAIIFDLDGTAIPNEPHGKPSQVLINAIADAQGLIKLCAATGRPFANAEPILTALKLKDPCVISAGTQIVNPLTGEIMWEANIEPDDVHKVLNICTPYKYEILTGNELLGEGRTDASSLKIDGDVNVIYIMGCAKTDAETMLNELNKIPKITAAGVTSWTQDGIDVHVTHKEATKEHAITELLKMLGLNKDEVVGVGDADNDVHLFAGVGHKVAMGNGTDKLKALADEIAGPVENDGLASIILKYS